METPDNQPRSWQALKSCWQLIEKERRRARTAVVIAIVEVLAILILLAELYRTL